MGILGKLFGNKRYDANAVGGKRGQRWNSFSVDDIAGYTGPKMSQCPQCRGTKRYKGSYCEKCGGTGKIPA
jgi:hypothetical protein